VDETITAEPLITLHSMHRVVLQMNDDPQCRVIVVALGAFSHQPYIAHEGGVVRADTVYDERSYLFSVREYDVTPVDAR
jgi:hypothetical protein